MKIEKMKPSNTPETVIDKNITCLISDDKNDPMMSCIHEFDKDGYLELRIKDYSEREGLCKLIWIKMKCVFCPICGFSCQPERLNETAPKGDAIV